MINYEELHSFAQSAQQQIDNGMVEDSLRHLLSTRLNLIFPDNPRWIQAHADGTETYLHFLNSLNEEKSGYADVVVGKTAIEYEKNLNIQTIFQEGYSQVKEYCAGLFNQGINVNEIKGVLSDTVRWYGYSVTLEGELVNGLCGVNNIILTQVDYIDLSICTETEFRKFEMFAELYFNQVQMHRLNANLLVRDFGMDSDFYRRNIRIFKDLVNRAMYEKPEYAELIKTVWQSFVAYLGASDYGRFSYDTYVNELYLVTVAKMISANVISRIPLINDTQGIIRILNGKHFEAHNISNFVDYDYFGWLNADPYVEKIAECAMNIQRQLTSYDFSVYEDQDLFGELLAQLANREHRLLLGQEFTPHWVARDMVEKCITRLPDDECPRILDMCCGSGVFLIESIRTVREKFSITPELFDEVKDNIAFSCVTGFDIDPLAVMLAKSNWILSMNDLFPLHRGIITIPIYHADSMFVTTPTTATIPDDDVAYIILRFDENEILLPARFITPEYLRAYNTLLTNCYSIAMFRAEEPIAELQDEVIERVVSNIQNASDIIFESELVQQIKVSVRGLILQLERLQRQGRNGIWHFVLSNSYKPGLSMNQFNCVISNPPWLAMSKLADNPYKTALRDKAEKYGINPHGPAHLHSELATVFLVGAIDKYLCDEGVWYCVMPGSILSGYNHEGLRREKYRESMKPVSMLIDEIWDLPKFTFKNKAVVLGGKKEANRNPNSINGRKYEDNVIFEDNQFVLKIQGNRSAWVDSRQCIDVEDLINTDPMTFNQGADMMPRTGLFHEFERQGNGNWRFGEITPTSQFYYLINQRKSDEGIELTATDFEDEYIYRCLTSKLMSPFYVSEPVNVIIPGRKVDGEWHELQNQDLALMNASTRNYFEQMQESLNISLSTWLNDKINIRGKLKKQNFLESNWLILSNAGGANPCAAYISLDNVEKDRLVIDQTLYWYIADCENEAKYITGLLNSRALADAIRDFQPEGEFGKRHIHTLPYKIMPRYDADNPAHEEVVEKTSTLINECMVKYGQPEYARLLHPNSGALNSRRKRQQSAIKELESYVEYENACKAVLGIEY